MEKLQFEHFKKLCQEHLLKVTNQRYVVFKTLLAAENHPTADQVFLEIGSACPGLSRDTVYRTLNTFTECGMARKLVLPGGATHFDKVQVPHHHFLCESCGQIADFMWPELAQVKWPDVLEDLGSGHSLEVLIRGRCHLCEKENQLPASQLTN